MGAYAVSAPSLLSGAQIEHFKTHGYLVLKNFFDEASIDDWRQQIWRKLGSSLDTPETWTSLAIRITRIGSG